MRQRPPFPGSNLARLLGLWCAWIGMITPAFADDEAYLFTPAGFAKPGVPKTVEAGPGIGTLRIAVVDGKTGKPTPCRVNVVGPDGNF